MTNMVYWFQVDRMREMRDCFHLLFVDKDNDADYPDCVNVCFWYVPRRLRLATTTIKGSKEWEQELGRVSI